VDDPPVITGRYAGRPRDHRAGAEKLARLRKPTLDAAERYRAAAAVLYGERKRAAEKLERRSMRSSKPLKLERARFSTEIATTPRGRRHGIGPGRVRGRPIRTRPGHVMNGRAGGEIARGFYAGAERVRRSRLGADGIFTDRYRGRRAGADGLACGSRASGAVDQVLAGPS